MLRIRTLLFGIPLAVGCMLAVAALIPTSSAAAQQPGGAGFPVPKPLWGPSWLAWGKPPDWQRPKHFVPATGARIDDDQSALGVSVRLWADAEIQKGHRYELRYQLRLHTGKGELGAILGSAAHPNGTAFTVVTATADDNWWGLEGVADVTRKDLSGMTHLPANGAVLLRVEPHLFDATDGKYVTPARTKAVIVVADVFEKRVTSIVSLRGWIVANANAMNKVLGTLQTIDEDNYGYNGIGDAIGLLLKNKDLSTAAKLQYLRALPTQVDLRMYHVLPGVLAELAAGDDAELQAAAKLKLAMPE